MLLLLCFYAVFVGSTSVTPVQKVVALLNELKEKGKEEKHTEEVQFATYKQFCEDTARSKEQAIKEGNSRIESLRATIAKSDADAKKLQRAVTEHEGDIAVFQGDKKASTRVRDIERTDYEALDRDYTESLDALGRAITLLKSKNVDRKQVEALLQQAAGFADEKAKRAIDVFLARDSEIGDNEHLTQAAPQANAYEFQSQGIVDTLSKLKEKFDDEREAARKAETQAKHAYEMLTQDLDSQIEESNRQRDQKDVARANKLQRSGNAKGELTDTTETRDDDQKYLSDLTATCEQKSNDFSERQQLRADEIAAIEKAIEIISSSSVSGHAEKHLPQDVSLLGQKKIILLQLRSSSKLLSMEGQQPNDHDSQERVASYLKNEASRIHSRVLSTLAYRVAADPLSKVKTLIKDLIVRLMEEATSETEQKGWCDKELTGNKHARDTKTEKVEILHATQDELTSSIAVLTEDISNLTQQVSDLDKAVSEAMQMRSEEKAKNEETLKDAREAQTAVTQAVAVLEQFYARAGEATALVEVSNKGKDSTKKQQPAAPEIFDSPYKGMQAGGGGILSILEVIQSDFARLEAETSAAETQAQKEHQEFLNDSELDKAQKNKDIEHKTESSEAQKLKLAETKSDLLGTQKELDAANSYYDQLKPKCVDTGVSHEERSQRRQEEIESLQEALRILSGEDI